MPLIQSAAKEAVGENIKREMAAGKPRRQAIAIALDTQRRNMAFGGSAPGFGQRQHMDTGGFPSSEMPYFSRQEARELYRPEGLIHLAGAGRTDTVPLSVAAGSYVIPADVVSGLGQGNTLAGAHLMDEILSTGPYGIRMPRGRGNMGPPHAPPPYREQSARGGRLDFRKGGGVPGYARGGSGKDVDILAAGGEYIVPPDAVEHLGQGDITAGHRVFDKLVKNVREHTHKTLAKLPGPKK